MGAAAEPSDLKANPDPTGEVRARRSAVVVAGMHRSGTSAVARLLSLLGLDLPRTPVGPRPSNELGHWGESEVIRALNDELLEKAGSSWDDVSAFPSAWLCSTQADELASRMVDALSSEYPGTAPFLVKDPRVCRLVPFWLGVLDDFGAQAMFVIPIRNPLEVAASLAARNGFSASRSLLLWLRHALDVERDTRARPRAFVSYDGLLHDRQATADAISAAIGPAWPATAERPSSELERLVPASQRHHAVDDAELRASAEVIDWVKEAFGLLGAAADGTGSPDQARLDELTSALNDADRAYGPVLAESELRGQDLRQELEAERARHKSATESRERKRSDALRQAEALRAESERKLSDALSQVEALRAELGATRAEVSSLHRESHRQRQIIEERRTRDAARGWRQARRRAGSARRTLTQLGSWGLKSGGGGRPRTAWEFLALRTSGLFDADFYLRRNPDVAAAGMDPLMHYLEHGARAGLDPSPTFSTSAYLAQRPALSDAGVNPLYDFWRRNGGSRRDRARDLLTGSLRRGTNQDGGGRPASRSPDSPTRPYAMFGDYLAYAAVDPQITVPYAEADRRVVGAMDSHRRRLAAHYAAHPPGVLVSVIMPTHDRLPVLRAAIASVRGQRFRDWELIVIDDGSEDGTSEYVAGLDDERIRLIVLPENRGVAAARNAGLREARGELIAYLDSDNSWHPDYLTVMAGFLGDHPDADVAYCAQEIWHTTNADGRAARELEAIRYGPFNRALLENRNYIDLNAIVHTAGILARSGPFEESLPRLVDWELLLRYTVEKPALGVPCVLSRYERGGAPRQLTTSPDWRAVFDRMLEITRTPRLDLRLPGEETRASSWGAHPLHRIVGRTNYRRPFAIVIPSFEAEAYLRACVDSVRAHTDGDYRLIIVDNGSGERVRSYLRSLADVGAAEVLQNEANLGFSAAANRGMDAAGDDRDIVLLNNDALATPGWIPGMWEVFDHVDDVGLVVPRQTLFPGTPTIGVHVPFSRADREVDVSLSAHHANVLDPLLDRRRGYVELRFGTFFCAYVPRETVNDVGSLNAEHGPHYRSDRLYCDMVREFAKRKIVYTPHSKLYHFLQRSTSELQAAAPASFEDMFVRNDWGAVTDGTRVRPAPAPPDAGRYGGR